MGEFENAKATLGIAGQLVGLAKESPELNEAGQKFASSALVVSKAVQNVLLPIAAVNYAFDKGRQYFQLNFQNDLEAKTAEIAPENIVDPKASVAGPVLQGLAFSHEEPSLKDMYLSLLRTAMDRNETEKAHPAFAEIIRQLTAVEADLLIKVLSGRSNNPICRISAGLGSSKGEILLANHCMPWCETETQKPKEIDGVVAMIDNWIRLGLIEISYEATLTRDSAYDWVEKRPEYLRIKSEHGDLTMVQRGYYRITEFGNHFANAVS
jgi:hypothetical protein